MRRILVVGNAGSGKSTVGRYISNRLGLPYVNLDTIRWQAGWRPTPLGPRRRALREIAERREWVVDGTAPPLFEEADTVVFLDVPRPVCLRRVVSRALAWRLRCRPELPHSPELKGLMLQLRYLWRFPRTYRPQILSLAGTDVRLIHVRGTADLSLLMARIRAMKPTRPRGSPPRRRAQAPSFAGRRS
jgi:adenylate kinase family enzyme